MNPAAAIITLVFLGLLDEDISVRATQKTLKSLSAQQKVIANMIAFDHEHKGANISVEIHQLQNGDLMFDKNRRARYQQIVKFCGEAAM